MIMINQSQNSPRNYEINRSMTNSSLNEEKIIQEVSNAQLKPTHSFYQNEMSDVTSEFLEISESTPLRLNLKEYNSSPVNNVQKSTKTSSNSQNEPIQKRNEVQNKPRKESIQKTSKFKQIEAFESSNLNEEAIVLEIENERNRLKPIEDIPPPSLEKKPKNSLEKIDISYPMLQRGSVSEQHIRQIIEQRPRSPSKFMNQEIQIIKSNKLEKQDSKENICVIKPQKIEKKNTGIIKTDKKEWEKGQTVVNLSSIPSFCSDLRM